MTNFTKEQATQVYLEHVSEFIQQNYNHEDLLMDFTNNGDDELKEAMEVLGDGINDFIFSVTTKLNGVSVTY